VGSLAVAAPRQQHRPTGKPSSH